MNARFVRLVLGLILIGTLALFACQLPERVIQSLSQAQPTGAASPGVSSPYPGAAYPSAAYPGADYPVSPYPGAV